MAILANRYRFVKGSYPHEKSPYLRGGAFSLVSRDYYYIIQGTMSLNNEGRCD